MTGGGGGGGGRKFWNKLFAEAVNTEINCMQVKNKVFAGRRRHLKKCLHVKIFQPPVLRQKNNDPSLKQQYPRDMAPLKK